MHKVLIEYFKPSGKHYTDGSYQTGYCAMFNIVDEVKHMQKVGKLPGLRDNCGQEFYIHIDIEEPNNFGYPCLIHPLKGVE